MGPGTSLTVVYTGEPDAVYEFSEEGRSRTFGRDDDVCDIVIWSAINSRDLSRIAGRIWRMDDELWVRNLSTRHDLLLGVPGRPPEPPLPPRGPAASDPGPARSVPGELAFLHAPGGCELILRQTRPVLLESAMQPDPDATLRVPDVPKHLMHVAAALCEPLLVGAQLPAAYSEISRRAGVGSIKRTRVLVAELCRLYAAEVPSLHEQIIDRRLREEADLGLPEDARLHRGVWTFGHAGTTTAQPSSPEVRRRQALALPDYFEVAHLLVRRQLVTQHDLAGLEMTRDGG